MSNTPERLVKLVDIHLNSFDLADDGSLVGEFSTIEPKRKTIHVLNQSSINTLTNDEITLKQYSTKNTFSHLYSLDENKEIPHPISMSIHMGIGDLFQTALIDHATAILCPNTDDLKLIDSCGVEDLSIAATQRVVNNMACLEYDLQYRMSAEKKWIIDAYEESLKPNLNEIIICLEKYGFSVITSKVGVCPANRNKF